MSRSSDSWEDASPFAWIFGTALVFVALGGVARAIMDRRSKESTPAPVRASDAGEDGSLAGHPS